MPWANLAIVLAVLRRRGVDPRDITVYWDGEIDTGFQRLLPRYSEPVTEPADDDYDDEQD